MDALSAACTAGRLLLLLDECERAAEEEGAAACLLDFITNVRGVPCCAVLCRQQHSLVQKHTTVH